MTSILILIGVGIASLLATWIGTHYKPRWAPDLGFVSHRWIAEHRLSEMSDHR